MCVCARIVSVCRETECEFCTGRSGAALGWGAAGRVQVRCMRVSVYVQLCSSSCVHDPNKNTKVYTKLCHEPSGHIYDIRLLPFFTYEYLKSREGVHEIYFMNLQATMITYVFYFLCIWCSCSEVVKRYTRNCGMHCWSVPM